MKGDITMISGAEYDALGHRYHKAQTYRRGVRAAVKRGYRRRSRQAVRRELHAYIG